MSEQAPTSAPVAAESAPTTETPSTDTSSVSPQQTNANPNDVAALKDAAANGTPKQAEAAKKMLKRLEIKVNGKSSFEELPFEISEEHAEWMTKQIQKGRAGDEGLRKYGQLESEVGKFIERLKKDPRGALSDPSIGVDIKKLAAEVVEEEIKKSQMSPAEREKAELQAELKQLKEKQKKDKEESEQREFDTKYQQEYTRIEGDMVRALETNQMPKSSGAIKRMANYMLAAANNGINLTVEEIAPIVKQELQEELQELLNALDEDKAEAFIGKDVLTKLRKKNISKAKAGPTSSAKNAIKETSPKTEEKKPAKKQSFKDHFGF